jgi:2-dehydro-3-deoxyglucarate aldolase/4-hydroxy-2-oxoheptanedioate aldolase
LNRNALKEMCRTRDLKLGHFIVEFATPGIGHILKAAGCDFAFFDLEHSGFTLETAKSALRYFEAAQLPAFIRVPAGERHFIARACDIGAEGIMVPMVGTAAQAEAIVRAMKYFPRGERGVALGIAHDNFVARPATTAMTEANDRTTLFCLIETAEGIDNVDAIAAVDGVDCLWIGHFDLSQSLGIPGQFEHPDFLAAVDKVVAAGKRHNKALGRLVSKVEDGIRLYAQGFDFCCYSGDAWVLRDALGTALGSLREGSKS